MSQSLETCANFHLGLCQYQPIASGISTQSSRYKYKGAESNLLADEKGPQQGDPSGCLVMSIFIDLLS